MPNSWPDNISTSKHAFLELHMMSRLNNYNICLFLSGFQGIFIRYPSNSNFFSAKWLYAILATFSSNSSISCRHIN